MNALAGEDLAQGKGLADAPEERVFRSAILRWSSRSSRSFPWRDTADPFHVLVGEVLLQRTRGEHVAEVYCRFVERWPTPEALGRASVRSIASMIRPLGLAKRAQTIKRLGQELSNLGSVPLDPSELDELPGVGPYASHAVPIFVAGHSLPLVDWVIARVLRRYFGLPTDRRPNADSTLWGLAGRLASPGRARDLWLGVLDFAAATCQPRPRCPECPLATSCAYATTLDSVVGDA